MNMIYRGDGPAWTKWKPSRKLMFEHLNEAMIARLNARCWVGSRYNRLLNIKAAKYQLELCRRERLGIGGVYGVHWGN